MKIRIKNEKSELVKILKINESFGQKCGFPKKLIDTFNLCFDELINNIINYGYNDNLLHEINVKFSFKNEFIIIIIEDDAMQFNPWNVIKPDITLSANDRNIGGLGVHLVKSFMDKVDYKFKNGKNIITLKKKYNPSTEEIK